MEKICSHVMKKGKNVGKICGKAGYIKKNNQNFCTAHAARIIITEKNRKKRIDKYTDLDEDDEPIDVSNQFNINEELSQLNEELNPPEPDLSLIELDNDNNDSDIGSDDRERRVSFFEKIAPAMFHSANRGIEVGVTKITKGKINLTGNDDNLKNSKFADDFDSSLKEVLRDVESLEDLINIFSPLNRVLLIWLMTSINTAVANADKPYTANTVNNSKADSVNDNKDKPDKDSSAVREDNINDTIELVPDYELNLDVLPPDIKELLKSREKKK